MAIRKVVDIFVLFSFIHWNVAIAAPIGSSVVAGQASVSQQGNVTQVTQTSQNAVINWQSFNTNSSEQVNFTQPNAQSTALNRITSGLPTQFGGLLTANGQVWIVNPAGVFFTGTSKIDAAGILATTLDIKNNDFMQGSYHFSAVPGFANTSVINNGEINTIQDNGLVALVAPGVANNGIIRANAGKVVLASGTNLTLDLYGDNLISFAAGGEVVQTPVDQNGKPMANAISNNGKIETNNNSQVLLTANAAEKVVQNVVSMNGVIEAKNAVQTNSGVIILGGSAGTVSVGGKINSNHIKIKGHKTIVNGVLTVPVGGFLETSGDYLDVNSATLNLGSGSTWLIDPWNISVVSTPSVNNSGPTAFTPTGSSSEILNTLINTQLNANVDVTLNTSLGAGADPGQIGNITISAPITAAGTGNLNLIADNNIVINAGITLPNGALNLTAANTSQSITTNAAGAINVGTFNLQQGQWYQNSASNPAFSANNFQMASSNVEFIRAAGGNGTSGSPYQLTDIYGVQGIGSSGTTLGDNFVLNNNIDASGSVNWNSGAGFMPISSFTGNFDGNYKTITDLTINLPSTNTVGLFSILSGSVSNLGLLNMYIVGNQGVGGIAASNSGNISNSFTTGYISDIRFGGGIAGFNFGTVSDSYSTAYVQPGFAAGSGGLVGNSFGNVINSYAINSSVGLIGVNNGTATSSYWNTDTSSSGVVGPSTGITGVNTATLQAAVPVGWNTSIWEIIPGTSYPYLKGFYTSGTPRIISGSTTSGGGNPVVIAANGAVKDTTYTASQNGAFYSINANGVIPDSADVLVYLGSGSTQANNVFLAPTSGGSVTDLSMIANTVQVGNSNVAALSNTNLDNAKGGLSSAGILYSYNFPTDNLILGSGVDLNTSASTAYNLGLNLTASGGGNVTFNGPVTAGKGLNAAVQVTASNILFNSTLDTDSSVNPLSNNIGLNGNVQFNGDVGVNISPVNITIFGNTQINTDTISALYQDYEGSITLNHDTTLLGSTIILGGDINGSHNFTVGSVATNPSIFIEGNIGNSLALNTLTLYGNTSINNAVAGIHTTGSQNYNAGTGLFNNVFINTTLPNFNFTGSVINFNIPLLGISPTSVTMSGNAVFNANIGADQFGSFIPLNALTVTGTTKINTGIVNTTGLQIYQGPVSETSNATLTASTVDFQDTLSGDIFNPNNSNLIINGNAIFGGPVGVIGNVITSLDVTGTSNINTYQIRTYNDQHYEGPVVLGGLFSPITLESFTNGNINFGSTVDGAKSLNILAGNTIFNGDVGSIANLADLTIFGGQTTLAAANVTTTGAQFYQTAMLLTNGSTNLSGDAVIFSGTLDGASDLTINPVTFAEFGGSALVGSITPLSSLLVNGAAHINTSSIETAGTQTYVGPVTVGADTNFTGSLVRFQSTLDGPSNPSIFGNAQFDADVGTIINLNSLSVSGSTTIGSAAITTTGTQTYSGPVFLVNGVFPTNLTGTLVKFGSTVDGVNDLTITGDAEFDNNVGVGLFLQSLTVTGQTALNAPNVVTFGDQNYQGLVTLGSSVTFNVNNLGNQLIFGSDVQGAGFDINATASTISFNGNVGTLIAPLGNLTLSTLTPGSGFIEFNGNNQVYAASVTTQNAALDILAGSLINTTGDQTYNDPVVIANSLVDLIGGNIIFNNTVASVDGNQGLNITSSVSTQFNGEVGNGVSIFTMPLDALTVTSPLININTDYVVTHNAQDYQGPVQLGNIFADLYSVNDGNIIFGGTLDGSSFLAIYGAPQFNGEVGGINPLSSLYVSSGGLVTVNTDLIKTLGAQQYYAPVVLQQAANFEGSSLVFGNTLDGLFNLITNTSGAVTFGGDVNVNAITLNSPTVINGASSITTINGQTYNQGISLGSNSILMDSNVSIYNGISGVGYDLGINAVNTIINGPVSVNNLTVTGTGVSNSFSLDTGSAENWNITSPNTGNVTGLGSFSNIQTLTGGSVSDVFKFSDGATLAQVNGGGGNEVLDFSLYVPGNPVSVIMSDSSTGSGNAYSALNGTEIDTNFPITAFAHISKVIGNSQGFFQVPVNEQSKLVISTSTPVSPTLILASGRVTDPIDFQDFLFLVTPPSNVPNLPEVLNILKGYTTAISTGSGCLGVSCESSDIIVVTDLPQDNKPAGHISCMTGFATAVDSMGVERIVMPGDEIYADEKIEKNDGGCIKIQYDKDFLGTIPGTSQFCPGEKRGEA